MPKKSSPHANPRMVVILDKKLMKKIKKLAAEYGIEPDEVLRELVRLEMSERPEGVTLH